MEVAMEQRIITEQEEQAIRLCHHEFKGFPIDDTAGIMGITVKEVKALLRSTKRKAPQMFPILDPRQRAVLALYDQHVSRATMCTSLGITLSSLKKEVEFLRKHGFLFSMTAERYDPVMHDALVKERF
jgi:biotin operon repressor